MSYIKYNGMLRQETDEAILQTLLSKGWELAPLPTIEDGQRADWVNGQWVVSDIVVPVPKEVSLRQFLMATDRSGLLAQLEALKTNEALPLQTRRDIHFFLEYSNFIERDHPLITSLAPVLGVTSAQIDEVFTLAASL